MCTIEFWFDLTIIMKRFLSVYIKIYCLEIETQILLMNIFPGSDTNSSDVLHKIDHFIRW